MVRKPAVAGMFYPGSKKELEKDLEEFVKFSEGKKIKGLISPHAGYVYSGGCAGKGFGKVKIPEKVIILGVNHRGFGHSFAVDGNECWNTPLGDVSIDNELRTRLVENSSIFSIDSVAGREEHSLEVQVPFIQFINHESKILPITISSMNLNELIAGGKEISELFKENQELLMVASTDMSHYIDAESARVQDQKVIDRILEMNPEGLFETVVKEGISMCGVAPTVMMLSAAIEAGATSAEVVEYTNSGITSGDYRQVVGYLSMIVY